MPSRLPAFALFFPAAGVWGLAAVAVKVAEVAGLGLPLPAGDWHGHEMVVGYAYAVVGGFLITRPAPGPVLAAFAAWLAGRAAFLVPDLPPTAAFGVAIAYPLALFLLAGVPLARAAKRPRNRIFAPLLGAMLAAEALYRLGAAGLIPGGTRPGLLLAIDLILLLLFVMGGRILATVSSGSHQERGWKPVRASHPRLERFGAGCLMGAALADLSGMLAPLAGLLSLAAAVIILRRQYRWRPWRILTDPGVAPLHAGYAWLAVGLGIKGGMQIAGIPAPFGALHVILVGGLGTLTVTVMTRVARQRTGRGRALPPPTQLAVVLVSVAALSRAAALAPAWHAMGVMLAGAAWTLALVLFLVGLAGALPQPGWWGRSKATSRGGR